MKTADDILMAAISLVDHWSDVVVNNKIRIVTLREFLRKYLNINVGV